MGTAQIVKKKGATMIKEEQPSIRKSVRREKRIDKKGQTAANDVRKRKDEHVQMVFLANAFI